MLGASIHNSDGDRNLRMLLEEKEIELSRVRADGDAKERAVRAEMVGKVEDAERRATQAERRLDEEHQKVC